MTKRTARVEYDAGPYDSIEAIERANRATGHHFFDDDTLRFFRSRISDTIYGGRFFVTSEASGIPGDRRGYTVRIALPDGGTDDAGGFQGFSTSASAHRAAALLADALYEVRRDPYKGTEDREPNPDHYEWRVWAIMPRTDDLPIGTRNTRKAAEKLARMLTREQNARRKATR